MSLFNFLPPRYIDFEWMNPSMLRPSWEEALREEFDKDYFAKLNKYLAFARASADLVPIYPSHGEVFAWSHHCEIEDVKVVIVGQDPSPYPGVACGLSFSAKYPDPPSRSLQNIFREMEWDIEFTPPKHGDLTKWAKRGVLLLNNYLTVRHDIPRSHHDIGWNEFTDAVIRCVSDNCDGVVFMLWGKEAERKSLIIDDQYHCVLTACHPAYRNNNGKYPFLGCEHFSQANEYLESQGKFIDWSL